MNKDYTGHVPECDDLECVSSGRAVLCDTHGTELSGPPAYPIEAPRDPAHRGFYATTPPPSAGLKELRKQFLARLAALEEDSAVMESLGRIKLAPEVSGVVERCGAWPNKGGCVLSTGHNRGKADLPENHMFLVNQRPPTPVSDIVAEVNQFLVRLADTLGMSREETHETLLNEVRLYVEHCRKAEDKLSDIKAWVDSPLGTDSVVGKIRQVLGR